MRRRNSGMARLRGLGRAARSRWPLALLLGAALLLPRPWWDAVRLRTLGSMERFGAGGSFAQSPGGRAGHDLGARGDLGGGGDRHASAREQALALALYQSRAALADTRAFLDQVTRLRARAPRVSPKQVVPVRVLGGEDAVRAARVGGLDRGFRVRLGRGEHAGIRVGDAVAVGAALLGRIVTVSAERSEALLLFAPSVAVRAEAFREGAPPERPPVPGIARGDGEGALVFEAAVGGADVRPGDRIAAAWGSAFAPEGILVGVCESVRTGLGSGRVRAEVRPVVRLRRLTRALVLIRPPPGPGDPGSP